MIISPKVREAQRGLLNRIEAITKRLGSPSQPTQANVIEGLKKELWGCRWGSLSGLLTEICAMKVEELISGIKSGHLTREARLCLQTELKRRGDRA